MRNAATGGITRRYIIRTAGAAALGGTLPRSPVRAQPALPTLSPVAKFDPIDGGFINTFALAPNGKMLMVCRVDDVTVWDLAANKAVRSLPMEGVVGAEFVGDGTRAITFSTKQVLVWTIADARVVRTVTHGGDNTWAVAVAPDGQSMVVGQDRILSHWNLGNGTRIKTYEGPEAGGDILRLAFSPDGKRLASTNQGALRMYVMPSLAPVADEPLLWSAGYDGGVAFSADSRRILVGEKEQVTLIDIASRAQVARVAGPTQSLFRSVAMLRDGDRFVAGDDWTNGRCWFGSLARGAFIAQSDPLEVKHVAISPDQRHAYICGGGPIYAFDVASLR
jgi:WD40 repeat protein